MGNETKKTDEAVKKIASEEKTTPVIPMGKVKEKSLQQLLDEKISKIQVVQKLSNQLLYLRKTQNKFNEFQINTDGQGDNIRITDSERRYFETTNSETIKKVIEVLKVDLSAKIVETEKCISSAQI
jgi:hypothetical protein